MILTDPIQLEIFYELLPSSVMVYPRADLKSSHVTSMTLLEQLMYCAWARRQ